MDGDGGGLQVDCLITTTKIRNSIIADNQALGGGLYPDCNTRMTGSFSLIGDTGPDVETTCGVSGFTSGMIYNQDPGFGSVSGLGYTYSVPLVSGSVAIDAASCLNGDGMTLEFDQAGAPVPEDGDGDGDAMCDMGAREFGSVPVLLDTLFLDSFE